MSYCKVAGCRFADTHVTQIHQCGKCKLFGHGRIECEDKRKKFLLQQYFSDTIPQQYRCTKPSCTYSESHTTIGHNCQYCGKINHMKQCPNINFNPILSDPKMQGMDISDDIKKIHIKCGYYIITYGGMGSTWYVRNNKTKIEYFFMHSDSWGQYGENSSDIPRLNYFIKGYKEQEN